MSATECSDNLSDDDGFADCLFCEVVGWFDVVVFYASEPAFEVEVDVFDNCHAVVVGCIILRDFLQLRGHGFVRDFSFVTCSLFAVECCYLVEEC